MNIYSKKILVTGATSGIGKALVKVLLEDKENEVFGIGRDSSKLGSILEQPNFTFLPFDLNKLDEIEGLLNSSIGANKFTGFVHCAGIEETLPISLYTPSRVQSIFTLNVFSAIEILRVLSKKKYSEDSASFILVSSVMGELGQAGKVGYCSSKAALLGVVNSLSLELSKRKIRVNAISPGIVETPLTNKLFQQLDEENVNKIVAMHPIGIGKPDDVVSLIRFLLSGDSRWITGQNIKIDGGYSVQ
ncbi:SDR family NAD(P)-dependent oxidoreductase [Sphingobacterium mizutaii]|uniref:SDR family NAD(P)-dependent oxidoreductase n=1 Tax=Sphingobacterium mizutaii TaxID=1010 RepID=UPI0028A0D8CC|nr:SDR family oxidoreductase [Sphingobacterium mizutaii]